MKQLNGRIKSTELASLVVGSSTRTESSLGAVFVVSAFYTAYS